METHVVIEHLTRALMAAYQALPVQEQEGPLGDQIHAAMHEARLVLNGWDRQH